MATTVYWYGGSPPCWKVFLTMQECGFPYEDKLLQASKGEHRTPEMLKLNPRGTVPVFVDGDLLITESLATCLHVINQRPSQQLLPSDGPTNAAVLQRVVEVDNLQTVLVDIHESIVIVPKEKQDPKVVLSKKQLLANELILWEGYLSGHDYLVGDTFSLADCGLFPYIGLFVRLGLQLEASFPNLNKYYNRLKTRPSVMKTWPPGWIGENKTILEDFHLL